MTDRHIGELAAAFVDGALGPDERDRVVAHLAACESCRDSVADQRRVKDLLAGLAAPGLPPGLVDRLRDVVPVPVPTPRVGGTSPEHPVVADRGARPDVPHVAGRHRTRLAVAGSSAVAAAVAVLVVATAGTTSVTTPTVAPPVQRFAVEHVAVAGGLPLEPAVLSAAQGGVAGGVAPGLAPATGTVTWTLPGVPASLP